MTNREQSVLDDIDALVDEQMAGGEPIGGYDYNDPDYPKCPHCHRSWHGLAITQRIEGMAWRGVMDPDYRYAEDDSPVLCPGSDFIGPVATPEQLHWIRSSEETKRLFPNGRIPSVQETLSAAMTLYGDLGRMNVWRNPFLLSEITLGRPAQPRRAALPEVVDFRNDGWYDHGAISGADAAVTPDRPYLNGPIINDGDRVAVVMGGRRYEGTAVVSECEVDWNRPWLTTQTIRIEDVREVPNEVRGFTAGPVIFDETHVFNDEDLRQMVETPRERALPRPADRPPMWANDPARTRRTRTRRTRNRARSIRTPRI